MMMKICTCNPGTGGYCSVHLTGQQIYVPPHKPVTIQFPAPRGWECPKCSAVMGPSAIVCVNCDGKTKPQEKRRG